jgi:hypothetical protein
MQLCAEMAHIRCAGTSKESKILDGEETCPELGKQEVKIGSGTIEDEADFRAFAINKKYAAGAILAEKGVSHFDFEGGMRVNHERIYGQGGDIDIPGALRELQQTGVLLE